MSRGKKTSPETIYKIMLSYAMTENYSETARDLNLAVSTVKKIVEDNKDNEEFVNLCKEKKKDFVSAIDDLIPLAIMRIGHVLKNPFPIPLNQLTTALGTLYDKRALAKGESTNNMEVHIKVPKEVEELGC